MGRSSSFNGLFAAFSLPFAIVTCSADAEAVAFTVPGAGVAAHTSSLCPWAPPESCASSCEGERERAKSPSEGNGDAVLGVPGDESGESAMVGRVRHYLEAYKLPTEGREPGARTARQYGSCMCMCMRCARAVESCVVLVLPIQSTWTAKRPWLIPVHIRPAFPHQARFLCNRRLRRHYASHCARCTLRVEKRLGNTCANAK